MCWFGGGRGEGDGETRNGELLPCSFAPKVCHKQRAENPSTYRAVSMYPGEMQLTRMPACAHSTARDAARWRTAALALLYGLWVV